MLVFVLLISVCSLRAPRAAKDKMPGWNKIVELPRQKSFFGTTFGLIVVGLKLEMLLI